MTKLCYGRLARSSEVMRQLSVSWATLSGLSGEKIAQRTELLLEGVRRLAKQARIAPTDLQRSPGDVALEYAAGDITRDQLLAETTGVALHLRARVGRGISRFAADAR